MKRIAPFRLLLAGCLLLAGRLWGEDPWVDQYRLLVDGYAEALHKRMANDPSFIAGSHNLSAVARSSSNKWATLIAPGIAISARHWHPATGNTLRFFETNDPNGNWQDRTVIGGVRVGLSDIWLCVLDTPLPGGYQPLPFLDEPIGSATGFNNSSIGGAEVFMVGRSDTVNTSVTNMAVGMNLLDHWVDSISDGTTTDHAIAAIQHIAGDQDFIAHEALLETYDSGAPLLMNVGGSLTVIGINWFILVNTANYDYRIDIKPGPLVQLRNASGFSYVGNYAGQIQAVLDAFTVHPTQGYITWMATAFGGVTDWAQTGPTIDFDGDGLNNFTEYAFALDPDSPGSVIATPASTAEISGSPHLQLTVKTRGDAGLRYRVRLGGDLQGWTEVDLAFNGSTWSSSQPAAMTVAQASNLGGGVWQLVLRDATPMAPGTPRFMGVGIE